MAYTAKSFVQDGDSYETEGFHDVVVNRQVPLQPQFMENSVPAKVDSPQQQYNASGSECMNSFPESELAEIFQPQINAGEVGNILAPTHDPSPKGLAFAVEAINGAKDEKKQKKAKGPKKGTTHSVRGNGYKRYSRLMLIVNNEFYLRLLQEEHYQLIFIEKTWKNNWNKFRVLSTAEKDGRIKTVTTTEDISKDTENVKRDQVRKLSSLIRDELNVKTKTNRDDGTLKVIVMYGMYIQFQHIEDMVLAISVWFIDQLEDDDAISKRLINDYLIYKRVCDISEAGIVDELMEEFIKALYQFKKWIAK